MSSMTGSSVQDMLKRQEMQTLLKYSLIVVASVPVLEVYPFVQKHLVKGVMIGSVKGCCKILPGYIRNAPCQGQRI